MTAASDEALSIGIKIPKQLEAFLEMLAAERGAAPLTVAAYRNDLVGLSTFLAAGGAVLQAADAASLHAYWRARRPLGWRLGPSPAAFPRSGNSINFWLWKGFGATIQQLSLTRLGSAECCQKFYPRPKSDL